MVLAVRDAFPSNPKEFAMLMSFALAVATMIALLGSQTILRLVNAPIPLRSRRQASQRRPI
jgi:hypothetical protein